jgi:hypothetical protein
MGGLAHTRPGAILIVLLLWDPHLRLRKLLLQSKSKRCGVRIPQFPRRRICVRRQAATRATRRRHHMCCCAATATVTHGTRETSHGLEADGTEHAAAATTHRRSHRHRPPAAGAAVSSTAPGAATPMPLVSSSQLKRMQRWVGLLACMGVGYYMLITSSSGHSSSHLAVGGEEDSNEWARVNGNNGHTCAHATAPQSCLATESSAKCTRVSSR